MYKMNRPYYEYFGRQSQRVSNVRSAQKCLHKDEYGRCVYYSHDNPVGTLTKHVTDDPYMPVPHPNNRPPSDHRKHPPHHPFHPYRPHPSHKPRPRPIPSPPKPSPPKPPAPAPQPAPQPSVPPGRRLADPRTMKIYKPFRPPVTGRLSAEEYVLAQFSKLAEINNTWGRRAAEDYIAEHEHLRDRVRINDATSNRQVLTLEIDHSPLANFSNPREIKRVVAHAGSEEPFSSATSAGDWIHNLHKIVGSTKETLTDRLIESHRRAYVREFGGVDRVYNPDAITGHSKGGQTANKEGVTEGIPSVAFNPNTAGMAGRHPRGADPTVEHKLIRTPYDPATVAGIGRGIQSMLPERFGGSETKMNVKTVRAKNRPTTELASHTIDAFLDARHEQPRYDSVARNFYRRAMKQREYQRDITKYLLDKDSWVIPRDDRDVEESKEGTQNLRSPEEIRAEMGAIRRNPANKRATYEPAIGTGAMPYSQSSMGYTDAANARLRFLQNELDSRQMETISLQDTLFDKFLRKMDAKMGENDDIRERYESMSTTEKSDLKQLFQEEQIRSVNRSRMMLDHAREQLPIARDILLKRRAHLLTEQRGNELLSRGLTRNAEGWRNTLDFQGKSENMALQRKKDIEDKLKEIEKKLRANNEHHNRLFKPVDAMEANVPTNFGVQRDVKRRNINRRMYEATEGINSSNRRMYERRHILNEIRSRNRREREERREGEEKAGDVINPDNENIDVSFQTFQEGGPIEKEINRRSKLLKGAEGTTFDTRDGYFRLSPTGEKASGNLTDSMFNRDRVSHQAYRDAIGNTHRNLLDTISAASKTRGRKIIERVANVFGRKAKPIDYQQKLDELPQAQELSTFLPDNNVAIGRDESKVEERRSLLGGDGDGDGVGSGRYERAEELPPMAHDQPPLDVVGLPSLNTFEGVGFSALGGLIGKLAKPGVASSALSGGSTGLMQSTFERLISGGTKNFGSRLLSEGGAGSIFGATIGGALGSGLASKEDEFLRSSKWYESIETKSDFERALVDDANQLIVGGGVSGAIMGGTDVLASKGLTSLISGLGSLGSYLSRGSSASSAVLPVAEEEASRLLPGAAGEAAESLLPNAMTEGVKDIATGAGETAAGFGADMWSGMYSGLLTGVALTGATMLINAGIESTYSTEKEVENFLNSNSLTEDQKQFMRDFMQYGSNRKNKTEFDKKYEQGFNEWATQNNTDVGKMWDVFNTDGNAPTASENFTVLSKLYTDQVKDSQAFSGMRSAKRVEHIAGYSMAGAGLGLTTARGAVFLKNLIYARFSNPANFTQAVGHGGAAAEGGG